MNGPDLLSTLPSELLDQIFDHDLNLPSLIGNSTSDDSIFLLNKRLLPFIRKLVYRHVRLSRHTETKLFLETMAGPSGEFLGPLVDTLGVNFQMQCRRDHHWTPIDLIPSFRHLTNLRALEVLHALDFVGGVLSKEFAEAKVLQEMRSLAIAGSTDYRQNPYHKKHYAALRHYPSLDCLSLAFAIDHDYEERTWDRVCFEGKWIYFEDVPDMNLDDYMDHASDIYGVSDFRSEHSSDCEWDIENVEGHEGINSTMGWNRKAPPLPEWTDFGPDSPPPCNSLRTLIVGKDCRYKTFRHLSDSGGLISLFPNIETLSVSDGEDVPRGSFLAEALRDVNPNLKHFALFLENEANRYVSDGAGFHLAQPLLPNLVSLTMGHRTLNLKDSCLDPLLRNRMLSDLRYLESLTLQGELSQFLSDKFKPIDRTTAVGAIRDLVRPSTKPPNLRQLRIDEIAHLKPTSFRPRRGGNFGDLDLAQLPSNITIAEYLQHFGWKLPVWPGRTLEYAGELSLLASQSGVALEGQVREWLDIQNDFDEQLAKVRLRKGSA